ncbi:ABC transporter permease [Leucobacter luti]|uniref:Peptide/nickel transport system permease protein n=1 Tax=Leucobacter luti TaxID=340320 RepID=A0A4R6S1B5_9MICO|nr:ABC transporter permease [Leucobacter luti]QYM74943.1 ABC transporter permease [Leucobacter luti]TDP93349.1 peptide/nickel transport system permease protein [Leucobacter luti]
MKLSPRVRQAITPLRAIMAIYLLVMLIVMVFAPLLAPYDPIAQNVALRLQPIFSEGHILGTDELGRDILSRIMYGAQIELFIALGATLLATALGTLLGLLGAYFSGLTEFVTMRLIVDVVLAFPPIILALLAVTLYGPGSITLIIAIGVLFAPIFARITYGQVLSVKREEYVDAAKTFGAPTPVILFKTVLPNVSAPIIVQFSLTMAAAILLESGLSYLGLGVVPPTPSWGSMVAQGQRYLTTDPHALLVPGAFVVITILAFGILGDALRDLLDPKAKQRS